MDVPIGKCHGMCPDKEIAMRERENLLHVFEMEPGTERYKRPQTPQAKRNWVVKEYTRPAAGKEDARPEDLRPPEILQMTVGYLISSICPRTDRPWNFVYDYVFDRMRAIRKDMVIQRISGMQATFILERIVRFHIYAGYRLCNEHISVYDPKINDTHTQECLKRLLLLYEVDPGCRQNMGEMVAIYVLYNLGQSEALQHAVRCKVLLRSNAVFMKALDASISSALGNYYRVLRLCRQMAPIYMCAVHSHLGRIQREALCVMSNSHHSKSLRFGLSDIVQTLAFDSENVAVESCRACGLEVNEKGVLFNKSSFQKPEKLPPRHHAFIEYALAEGDLTSLLLGQQSLNQMFQDVGLS